jgi:hypothetical protein
MMSLKKAKAHAKAMTALHGEQWLVFITPANAKCNQDAYAIYNTGRFMACRERERAEYEAGGATFPTTGADKLNPALT